MFTGNFANGWNIQPDDRLVPLCELGASVGEIVKSTVGKKKRLSLKSTNVDWALLAQRVEHGVVILDRRSSIPRQREIIFEQAELA